MSSSSLLSRAAALFAASVLAACGGGSEAPQEPAAGAPPAPAPHPAPAPAPAPAADFTLTLSSDKLLVRQGDTATFTATVVRHGGFDGAVSVTLAGLPAGVSASPVLIAGGATSASITLAAEPTAAHSLPTTGSATGAGAGKTATVPLTVTVGGAPGRVDTSFNGGAQLVSVAEGEDYALALAVQADGKVVSVGRTSTVAGGTDIAITRHLRDGTLDPAFGQGGKVVTAVAPGRGGDEATAVLVQPDGRIVVGGYTEASGGDRDFLVVRYLADGALDASFGDGGKAVTKFGTATDQIYALALQGDGKIVAAGTASFPDATGQDFALVRYTADGALDAGFGDGGKTTTSFSGSANERAYGLVLQPLGGETRIVAVGGEGRFIAARYTAAGTLDATFGNGGRVHALFPSTIGAATSATVADDGKLVLAGHIGNDVTLVRLDAGGALDPSFGDGGRVTSALSATNWDAATAIVRQADGKLVVGGWVYAGAGSSADFAVLRYSADGAPDATFGDGGRAIVPVAPGGRGDSGRALALQPDDRVPTVRVLQAGEASDGGNRFALVRYWL